MPGPGRRGRGPRLTAPPKHKRRRIQSMSSSSDAAANTSVSSSSSSGSGSGQASSSSSGQAVEIRDAPSKWKCEFCSLGSKPGDLLQSGKFFRLGKKYFHYFCVLFSRDGVQLGEDDEGLFGFFLKDISKELERGAQIKCQHCSGSRATVECRAPRCQTRYHFPCGYKAGAAFVFKQEMASYCAKHLPKQKASIKMKVDDKTCLAGCSELTTKKERCVSSPCCGRRFHATCLQQMALQSGQAHYKCPVCSSKKDFYLESLDMGIYVPEQDASWENPQEEEFYNYTQMGRLYQNCDAARCLCPKGRQYHMAGTRHEIIRCSTCGCQAVHIECGKLIKERPDYTCQMCRECQENAEEEARRLGRRVSPEESEEESSSESEDDDVVEAVLRRREAERRARGEEGTSAGTSTGMSAASTSSSGAKRLCTGTSAGFFGASAGRLGTSDGAFSTSSGASSTSAGGASGSVKKQGTSRQKEGQYRESAGAESTSAGDSTKDTSAGASFCTSACGTNVESDEDTVVCVNLTSSPKRKSFDVIDLDSSG